MANLKEIRNRITSVNSTKQITSAMKMVSAAKLKRAQDAITQMRPYAEKLQSLLSNLSASIDTSENIYSQERESNKTLVVGITSNKGLCGAFNGNVIKRLKSYVEENGGENVDFLAIGRKANDYVKKTEFHSEDLPNNLDQLFDDLTFDNVAGTAQDLMDYYISGKYDKIILVYNKFKNAATQILMTEQFLPIIPNTSEDSSGNVDYIYEPRKKEIVSTLIPKSLKIQLYKAILDSNAAEHGARMTAMHKATDNATELLKDLKLTYNKARQAAITNEILEIVSGAEALKN